VREPSCNRRKALRPLPNVSAIGGIVLSLCLTLLLLDPGTFAYQGQPHQSPRAKFEPPDGKTILVIGQAPNEINDYARKAGTGDPGGYMNYADLRDFDGRTATREVEAELDGLVKRYPRSVGQIGISMVGELEAINRGQLDDNIRTLGEVLRRTNKPIFLRIGYEFDGPWNAYKPALYVSAFQRIVSILRGDSINNRAISPVNNVAFVWHSAAWNTFESHPIGNWYPGDSYVDWIAVSWFAWTDPEQNKAAEDSRATDLDFARQHAKPVMIAEAAPKKYFAPENPRSWDGWYSKVFQWIALNNVKGFSYINQDWNAQAMFANGDWGNSRVQNGSPSVLHRWQAAVEDPRFLRASDDLFGIIGFTPQP
jgi:hypothetical protein